MTHYNFASLSRLEQDQLIDVIKKLMTVTSAIDQVTFGNLKKLQLDPDALLFCINKSATSETTIGTSAASFIKSQLNRKDQLIDNLNVLLNKSRTPMCSCGKHSVDGEEQAAAMLSGVESVCICDRIKVEPSMIPESKL